VRVSRLLALVVAVVVVVAGLLSWSMYRRRAAQAPAQANGTLAGAVEGPDRKPVAGATVSAFRLMKTGDARAKRLPEPSEERRTTTDGDGTFRLPGLRPGMYLVSATAAGHTGATVYRPVAVFAGEVDGAEVRLGKEGFLLSGRVRDGQQAPIAGASIRLFGIQLPTDERIQNRLAFATSTDDAGSYRLQVPPGRYQLRVTADGSRTAKASLDLTADTARDFQLQPARR
jgi:protocatechuate 3,4-dioxygenase beta subunit